MQLLRFLGQFWGFFSTFYAKTEIFNSFEENAGIFSSFSNDEYLNYM